MVYSTNLDMSESTIKGEWMKDYTILPQTEWF